MISLTYHAARQEPLLAIEQERTAIRKWQDEADKNALELLIRSHARQAWAQAISWANNPVHIEDLVTEGIIGLVRAANNFDLKFKVRFSTYATWWVSAGISAALARVKVVIDIPSRTYIEACGGRIEDEKSKHALRAIKGGIPFDASLDETGSYTLTALHGPELNPEELMLKKSSSRALSHTLYKAMKTLNPIEFKIIKELKLNNNPDCVDELAEELKMTKTKLRQIERHALMRLRKELPKCGFELEMLN